MIFIMMIKDGMNLQMGKYEKESIYSKAMKILEERRTKNNRRRKKRKTSRHRK